MKSLFRAPMAGLLVALAAPVAAGGFAKEAAGPGDPRPVAAERAAAQAVPYQAPALVPPDEVWVEATLAGMTMHEKVGQMLMPVTSSVSGGASDLANYAVGGFAFVGNNNTSANLLSITNGLQEIADIPLLFGIDCEAGLGGRMLAGQATRFPMNMGLAATRDEELARQQAVVTARECRAIGIHVAFAPVVDVNTEPENPIISIRSYGDDPALAARMARAYVQGAESAGLLTTFKHFPGHGPTVGDSHNGIQTVNISCDELQAMHVAPYADLVAEGLGQLIMSAHVWYPCLDPGANPLPGTISANALNGIARQQLGFDGVLISDAFNMAGLTDVAGTREGVQIAVEAGMDIILFPSSLSEAYGGLMDGISSGRLTEARIDESVRRILRLKSKLGMEESGMVDPAWRTETLAQPEHWAVAEAIGDKTVALGPLQQGVLPLKPQDRVLNVVLEPDRFIFYLYDHTPFTEVLENHLAAMQTELAPDGIGSSERSRIVQAASQRDVIVVSNRNWKPYFNGDFGQRQLVNDLIATGKPVVYVTFGSPYDKQMFPGLQTYVAGFSSHYASQEAAARFLLGRGPADGYWPVSYEELELPLMDVMVVE